VTDGKESGSVTKEDPKINPFGDLTQDQSANFKNRSTFSLILKRLKIYQ
jgi:hypothetical protein